MFNFRKKYMLYWICAIACSWIFSGCKKYLEIPPPNDRLTADFVFTDKAAINSALTGLYIYGMSTFNLPNEYPGVVDLLIAIAADDAINQSDETLGFYTNTFSSSDIYLERMWSTAYLVIGRVNSFVEGVQGATVISEELKSDYLAQARLMRAFYYFNLTNLFGDVPLVKDANVHANALLGRSPRASVDSLIMDDLLFAHDHLTADEGKDNYSFNQNTANLMLARMYAYKKDWVNVESAANAVMNTGRYSLSDIAHVFSRGNAEAIYQYPNKGTVFDGYGVPAFYGSNLIRSMTPSLINSFDTSDLRLHQWIEFKDGNYLYNKYTYYKKPLQQDQEYVLFRLADLILLRAEARAEQSNLSGALNDLNLIRERAGLKDLADTLSQSEILEAMMSERRKEFFAEGITRWFDLSRWGKLQSTMSAVKPNTWTEKAALFPITSVDLSLNPNLTQTPGY